MTVKELINELLECPMGAEVNVLVEMRKDFMKERMERYQDYAYAIDDDADIKHVYEVCHNQVRIILEEASEWR